MSVPGFSVSFRVPFTTMWSKRSNCYLLHCPSLNLYSQCWKKEDAPRAMSSAISMLLRGHMERNSLDEVLGCFGFQKISTGAPDDTFIEVNSDMSSERFHIPRAMLFDAESETVGVSRFESWPLKKEHIFCAAQNILPFPSR